MLRVRLVATGGSFALAFAQAIALAFNGGDVGVVRQAVKQRGNPGRVGKDARSKS